MSNGGAVAEHDSGYKSLFSHPEMVEDLLRGFAHEDWVRDLDFSTLEELPGGYVAPNLSAAQEISELIEEVPGGLERYRPQLRYFLLDEMRMADSELEPLRNLAAVMFRLEKSRGTEAMERVLGTSEWLRAPGLEGVRRSLALWVLQVLLPSRIRGVRFPEYLDLEEIQSMLAESGFSWSDQWEQEGIEKGRKEERQEALAKARGVLLRNLERRFGPLPEDFRQRVEAVASIEELTELTLRAGAASSLADLTAP
jgi:hypothetical protein